MINEKIKKVCSLVFDIPEESIDDNFSSNTSKVWTSLGHMNLILALEQEFGIEFNDDQILEMTSYSALTLIVKDALLSKKD